jgi:SAM-dependent methyltransferase
VLAIDDLGNEEIPSPPTLTDARQLYGRWYYDDYCCGLPYHYNDHWKTFFGRVADSIARQLQPTTVLDAGCAKGFLVAALRDIGVEAEGFDMSEVAVATAPESARGHVRVASLTEPIEGRYDLVTCIEVIEHLDPADAVTAVANLCAASDLVLLSSSPGDLHEATHVNVQPQERWSQLFASHGFYRDFRHDAAYLTPWATLYRREERSIGDLVVDYDRAWAHLRAETMEQRRALLEAHTRLAQMSEREEAVNQFETEREDLRKEVLRLRDALIGREAELGTALGREAELRARVNSTEDAAVRLNQVLSSRSWKLMWLVGKPVRALRAGRAR